MENVSSVLESFLNEYAERIVDAVDDFSESMADSFNEALTQSVAVQILEGGPGAAVPYHLGLANRWMDATDQFLTTLASAGLASAASAVIQGIGHPRDLGKRVLTDAGAFQAAAQSLVEGLSDAVNGLGSFNTALAQKIGRTSKLVRMAQKLANGGLDSVVRSVIRGKLLALAILAARVVLGIAVAIGGGLLVLAWANRMIEPSRRELWLRPYLLSQGAGRERQKCVSILRRL